MVVRDGAVTLSAATDTTADAVDATRGPLWIGLVVLVTVSAQSSAIPSHAALLTMAARDISPVARTPSGTMTPVAVTCTCTLDARGPQGMG